MQVERLQTAELAGGHLHRDQGVLAAAPLAQADREVDVPLAEDGPAGEGRVAVAALAEGHVVADRVVLEAQRLRQLAAEVHLA